jgi:hypothetical protein
MSDKDKLKVDIDDMFIVVEDEEGRFVKGKKRPSFGLKKQIQNKQRPDSIRYKGKNDVIMKLGKYDIKEDQDLFILRKMLTDWSHDKEISGSNIINEEDLMLYVEKFVEEFKEINDIAQNDEEDEEEKN